MTPEQIEQLMKEAAENRLRQEALTQKQLLEEGKYTIILLRAPDDPLPNDPEFLSEILNFRRSLNEANITAEQLAIAMDAVDGGGYPLAEFFLILRELANPPAIAVLGTLLGIWIQSRYGRKVRLKVGDVEAEANNVADVKELLEIAAEQRKFASGTRKPKLEKPKPP